MLLVENMLKNYCDRGFSLLISLVFMLIISTLLVYHYSSDLKLKRIVANFDNINNRLKKENVLFNQIYNLLEQDDFDIKLLEYECNFEEMILTCSIDDEHLIKLVVDIEKKLIIDYNY